MANMISTISLCNVPITPTHQIDFKDINEQTQYFESKRVLFFSNCKYQPRTGKIKVKGYVDTFNNCNYGFYTNSYNGTNKTFYFWIVQKRALARETTELTIQLDVFQTWLFDFTLKDCFVEREHVYNDGIGVNTYPEDFEMGDYVHVNTNIVEEMVDEMAFLVAVTDIDAGNVGGLYSATYSGFKLRYYSEFDINSLTDYILTLSRDGKGDAIAFIMVFPRKFLDANLVVASGNFIQYNRRLLEVTKNIEMIRKFMFHNDEYIPFNNKLFTYPYNMITVYSPNGSNIVLKFENFYSLQNIMFRIEATLSPNPTFSLIPVSYNNFGMKVVNGDSTAGYSYNIVDSIETNCFGLCSWNNDNYANWFAQHQNTIQAQSKNAFNSYKANANVNSNNYKTNMANAERSAYADLTSLGANAIAGIFSNPFTAVGSAIGGGAQIVANAENSVNTLNNDLSNSNLLNTTDYENAIRSLMASVQDSAVQPNTAKGDTSANGLDVARNTSTFFINQTAIKPEYARKIDMYFQMYGYKVNTVKTPSFKTRMKWNYLKTMGCVVMGNIPLEDRNEIAGLFDNGVTVWHDESYMFNYQQINARPT